MGAVSWQKQKKGQWRSCTTTYVEIFDLNCLWSNFWAEFRSNPSVSPVKGFQRSLMFPQLVLPQDLSWFGGFSTDVTGVGDGGNVGGLNVPFQVCSSIQFSTNVAKERLLPGSTSPCDKVFSCFHHWAYLFIKLIWIRGYCRFYKRIVWILFKWYEGMASSFNLLRRLCILIEVIFLQIFSTLILLSIFPILWKAFQLQLIG